MLNLTYKYDCEGISFSTVANILAVVGMNYNTEILTEKKFRNSTHVVFVFDDDRLIAFARAISDGVCQATVYDVAVHPDFQGKGIGKTLIEKLKEKLSGFNIILYAAPGKEDFYRKLGFSRMLTGMALFPDEEMRRERGFIE